MTTLDFTSPKPEKEAFNKYWDIFVHDIKERDNLKKSHLTQLRILCDLCVELDELQEIIDIEGRTYESEGRNGTQIKLRPEIQEKNRVISEIRNYSKILGLLLYKDNKLTKEEDEDEFA